MAEDNQSSSGGSVNSAKFQTPPQSDDEQGEVNMQKIFLGGAYDHLDEDAQEALQHVSNVDLQMDVIKPEDIKQQRDQIKVTNINEQSQKTVPNDVDIEPDIDPICSGCNSDGPYSLSEDDVFNLEDMVQYKVLKNDPKEVDVKVLQFS